MANQEHLDILNQGVKRWNQWRKEHPNVQQLDLSGADLIGAHLSRANFRFVNLFEAQLGGAHLNRADRE